MVVRAKTLFRKPKPVNDRSLLMSSGVYTLVRAMDLCAFHVTPNRPPRQ